MKWFARVLFVGLVAVVLVVLAVVHVHLDRGITTGGRYPSVLELIFWCVVYTVTFFAVAAAIIGVFVWLFDRGWKKRGES